MDSEARDYRDRRIVILGAPSSFVTKFFAELLTQAGLHVDIVTWESGTESELIAGVPIVRVEMPRRQMRNVLLRLLRGVQSFVQRVYSKRFTERTGKTQIDSWSQDVIYAWLMRGPMIRAARRCRAELVIGLEASSYGLSTELFHGPRVIVPYGADIFVCVETWPFADRVISRALNRATLVSPASFAAIEHLQRRFGLSAKTVAPFWTGIVLDQYIRPVGAAMSALRQKWGLPADAVILTNCRRFRPLWGGETVRQVFLAIARQMPHVHFVLLRGGDEADELMTTTRSEAHAAGCESRFKFLERDLTAAEYREFAMLSDIYVSLMGIGDMRSMSVLEFAAGGAIPVIARQREYELMQAEGFDVILTPPDDVAATVQAILPLIGDSERREAIRRNNERYMSEHQDASRNRPEIVRMLTSLLPDADRDT